MTLRRLVLSENLKLRSPDLDPNGHIYESDDVPAEDKARLEGYLRGREEADLLADVKKAAYEAKVCEMERHAQGD